MGQPSACLYIVATFKKIKKICFRKRHLAYTISRQYNKYIGTVSRNEKYSIFESG